MTARAWREVVTHGLTQLRAPGNRWIQNCVGSSRETLLQANPSKPGNGEGVETRRGQHLRAVEWPLVEGIVPDHKFVGAIARHGTRRKPSQDENSLGGNPVAVQGPPARTTSTTSARLPMPYSNSTKPRASTQPVRISGPQVFRGHGTRRHSAQHAAIGRRSRLSRQARSVLHTPYRFPREMPRQDKGR